MTDLVYKLANLIAENLTKEPENVEPLPLVDDNPALTHKTRFDGLIDVTCICCSCDFQIMETEYEESDGEIECIDCSDKSIEPIHVLDNNIWDDDFNLYEYQETPTGLVITSSRLFLSHEMNYRHKKPERY